MKLLSSQSSYQNPEKLSDFLGMVPGSFWTEAGRIACLGR